MLPRYAGYQVGTFCICLPGLHFEDGICAHDLWLDPVYTHDVPLGSSFLGGTYISIQQIQRLPAIIC